MKDTGEVGLTEGRLTRASCMKANHQNKISYLNIYLFKSANPAAGKAVGS